MPVIKSIGRKDTNFGQLINYLHRLDGGERETFTYLHNMSGLASDDLNGMKQSFINNNCYRRKRKNGVGQYHEVMSFHPDDTQYLEQHPEILEDLARIYLELRAPDAIAIARPHTDKDHLHLHFMISPNELGNSKSIRLSKAQFQALRRTIEKYQLQQYPELTKSYVHSRDQEKYREQVKTQSHKEWQMLQRGMGIKDKVEIAATVAAVLDSTNDLKTFQSFLHKNGIEIYRYQGRLQGVVYNGRKYRFSRLLEKGSVRMNIIDGWNKRLKKINRKVDKNVARGL